MGSMTSCWACETQLRPEWKFCIHCGVPVETEAELAATSRERSPAPLALFGWIFACLGAALLITAIIVLVFVK
jgi:hypothetical protein